MPARRTRRPKNVKTMEVGLTTSVPIRASIAHHPYRTRPEWDMHYGFELGVVLSGRMRRHYLDATSTLSRGGVWLNGMWEPHGFSVTTAPCDAVVMLLLPQTLAALSFDEAPDIDFTAPFRASPKARPVAGRGDRDDVTALALRAVELASERGAYAPLRLRLVALEILLTLMSGWRRPARIEPPLQDEYARINPSVDLVLGTSRLVTEAEAARACHMSRTTFGTRFARLMGIPFSKFALRHRLRGAASQLRATNDPVKAIARDWGFTDASHMHRNFVRHYGCTPNEYRVRRDS